MAPVFCVTNNRLSPAFTISVGVENPVANSVSAIVCAKENIGSTNNKRVIIFFIAQFLMVTIKIAILNFMHYAFDY